MKLLTVATEPSDSLAVGTESTRIWKATVNNDPPSPPVAPPFALPYGSFGSNQQFYPSNQSIQHYAICTTDPSAPNSFSETTTTAASVSVSSTEATVSASASTTTGTTKRWGWAEKADVFFESERECYIIAWSWVSLDKWLKSVVDCVIVQFGEVLLSLSNYKAVAFSP